MPRSLCSTQAAFGARLDVLGLDAVDATMRPRSIGTRSSSRPRRPLADEGVEALGVGGRNVEEEERRRLVRQRGHELPAQIAVDLEHRHQQREAEPERQHDRRRQRARPVDVGDGEPQHGRARVRQRGGRSSSASATSRSASEHGSGGGDEDGGDAPVVGGDDRKAGERQRQHRGGGDIAPARPAALGATASRNSAETGTSCARPSGQSAKASAVRRP